MLSAKKIFPKISLQKFLGKNFLAQVSLRGGGGGVGGTPLAVTMQDCLVSWGFKVPNPTNLPIDTPTKDTEKLFCDLSRNLT